jgi:NADH dehydrogenase/NADH:ubiquinone oxidoreductase subunit G
MTDTNGASADAVDDGKVGLQIDGKPLRVAPGTLVWDAATQAGVHIPVYCAHPKMEPVAVCRMCLVTVEKMPKLQPACATVVSEGMVVHTQTDQVAKAREGMLEFLLLNHPLDCPVCDRGGECDLQDFAYRYGPETSRMPITDKVHFDKAVPLSDRIELDNERCILCWRCVRYYDEITGEKEIVLQERGVGTVVATFDNKPLKSDFQGNLPEICPVGALTHRQYRFVARPWDLLRAKGVCAECSYGCNVNADSRDFELVRFASRDNPLVDDMWLCDRGRYSVARWNETARVRRPLLRQSGGGGEHDAAVTQAVHEAARSLAGVKDAHGATAIGVLCGVETTNQEAFLLQRLAREVLGTQHLDHQLLSFPGLQPAEHELAIAELEECSAIVVLGERPEAEAPVLRLRLIKAERKFGVAVHRVEAGETAAALATRIAGQRLVGVVVDETERERGAEVSAMLAGSNSAVRRLTITRGLNGRGLKDLGILPALLPGYEPAPGAGKNGREILEAAADGQIKALVLLSAGGLIAAAGELGERALHRAEVIVAVETHPGPVALSATVLIPGHALLEKAGSVTNCEGRVQRVRPALPPASQTPAETRVLAMLAAELGAPGWPGEVMAVNRALLEAVPAYRQAGNGALARFAVAVA